MAEPFSIAHRLLEMALLALQLMNVAFLLLHDFVPLGRFNNLGAIRDQDSLSHRVIVTLLGGIPSAVGLYYSFLWYGRPYPHGVALLLWITYSLLLLGLLRAWWVPYLVLPDPARAARYQRLFAGTHTFLPVRNGLAPDTLHTVFHLSVAATLVLLALR